MVNGATPVKKEDFNWIDKNGKRHPYSEYDAQYFPEEFGAMLDYAVNYMHYDPEMFLNAFLESDIPEFIEFGYSAYIGGKDGADLCLEIERKVLHVDTKNRPLPQNTDFCLSATRDFWVGYMIALYQWHSNLTFKEILHKVPPKDFYDYYWRYHQEDEIRFLKELDRVCLEGTEK